MKPTTRTHRMIKRLTLLTALAVTAALLGGCALLPLLQTLQTDAKPEAYQAPMTTSEPNMVYDGEYEDGLPMERAAEEYMASGALESGEWYAGEWPEFNTEEYAAMTENGFRSTATSPLSTFSADVDTASWCNLRRMLNDGYSPEWIPAGSVRIEEMLNYFRYDYAAPEGGERFAVTPQLAVCPWNPDNMLLMLGVRAADAPEAFDEGSNLVFLVDVSGSMAYENKLGLVKRALVMLAGELTEKDTVSIVTYASGEKIVIEGANPARDIGKLTAAIERLDAGGSTNGERGLAQAYEVAMKYYRPRGNNRVILCSDGDLNVGITSESDLHDFVAEKKETGVYLSVLGFGEGNYKDTKMETLADDGNGNYYYIDSILEARKVLCEELTQTLYAVADDVKFQIEFNPAKVAMYRQVGYENRALEDQDFTDDTKDAGEVGAGACVTVLYELVPAGGEAGEGGLKYQTSQLTDAAAGDEWLTLSVRYKEPGGRKSEELTFTVGEADVADAPSGDFLFASAVAEFGMILKGSEYAGSSDYDTVLALLKQAPLSDPYREEFFSLVKIAQRAGQLNG